MSTMEMLNISESNTTSDHWITQSQTTINYDGINNTYSNMTAEHRITEGPTIHDVTTKNPDDEITWDDATWILTSAFIIFTMQSGESEFPFSSNMCISLFMFAHLKNITFPIFRMRAVETVDGSSAER